MSLITIEQLLESVDLDFDPRWIAKDGSGLICVYTEKPERGVDSWYDGGNYIQIGYLKLSEFDGKDWTECIYEVSRKTTGEIVKLGKIELSAGNMSTNQAAVELIVGRLNQVIDAVNELKGAKNE